MAKEKEKIQDETSTCFIPVSPIPRMGSDWKKQTCHLQHPNCIREHNVCLTTSTPNLERSIAISKPVAFDDVDGCCIAPKSRPTMLVCAPSEVDGKTRSSSSSVPVFKLDIAADEDTPASESGGKNMPSSEFLEESEKKTVVCENEALPKFSNLSNGQTDVDVCDVRVRSSSGVVPPKSFEFRKPSSPGSRKRLSLATVSQLHKDSLQEDKNTPCHCQSQVLTKFESEIADIITSKEREDNAKSSNSPCSNDLTLRLLNQNDTGDSGYLTLNSTVLSQPDIPESTLNVSCAISNSDVTVTPKLPLPDIPLPPIPMTTGVKLLTIEEALDKCLPYKTPPDARIGPKIGVEYIDILSELYNKGAWTCLRIILGLLEIKDLKCVCSVSPTWKRACLEDPRTKQRLKEDRAKSKDAAFSLGKENLTKLKQRTAASGLTALKKPTALRSNTFLENKDLTTSSHMCVSPTKLLTRGDQYIQAASKLKTEESLDKCPRCLYPAKVHKVQERGCCTKEVCQFDYCVKCRMAFHGSKPCVVLDGNRSKMGGIGTKRSRKNLRRL